MTTRTQLDRGNFIFREERELIDAKYRGSRINISIMIKSYCCDDHYCHRGSGEIYHTDSEGVREKEGGREGERERNDL